MRLFLSAVLLIVAAVAAQVQPVAAQGASKRGDSVRPAPPGQERGEQHRRGGQDGAVEQSREGRAGAARQAAARSDWLTWDVQPVSTKGKNGRGPQFCRTGEGHPVYGRQWCVSKGFGVGGGRWGRTRWNDAVFHLPGQRLDGELRAGSLRELLGTAVFGRLETHGRRSAAGHELTGRWVEDSTGPRVLLVQAGRVPLAELVDQNGDGRVDWLLLNAH